jgi:pilus assembly protein FimV
MGALASALALLGSVVSVDAHALALGRITVQSALGEPLRAEIDITGITSDEASSLRVGAAPADRFKAAGLEYSPVMAGLVVNLQRRVDGRAYLRLSSNRPVTEPFVDLILEANWSSGRIARDYTLLFDPPNMRYRSADAAATPTAPVLSPPRTPNAAPPREIAALPYPSPTAAVARPARVAKAAQQASPVEKTPVSKPQLTVKTGDTAGRIAAQTKSASVSLDQMLVALLKSNPDAFIDGNINRIKAGSVLEVPSMEAARATSPGEATQLIVAQSKDFNAFRRKLAQSAPSTQITSADRQDAGKLQANVEDRAPVNGTPDKLTLSKVAVQGNVAGAAEDKIAQGRQADEASTRLAELSKNISELKKLDVTPGIASDLAAADNNAKATGTAVPAPLKAPQASADQSSSGAAASPSATVVATAMAMNPVATDAPMPPESGLIDEWLAHPLILPLAGGLLALLAGFGFYRYRQRNQAAQVDSSFLESRLQRDSFLGASGGQRIDTREGNATGTSMVYSPSQLESAGDVDPVAEADVYLAYGRDLQAEEILKEALRTTPMRVAIHGKLLEIYAKRHDSKAFDRVAIDAFNLTQGFGPEWAYIAEMGREVEPNNPIYQPGGQPAAEGYTGEIEKFDPTGSFTPFPQEGSTPPAPLMDVDLALDFSLDAVPAATAIAAPPPPQPPPLAPEPAMATRPEFDLSDLGDMDLDFGSATAVPYPTSSAAPATRPVEAPPFDIFAPTNGLDFTTEPFAVPEPALPIKAADSGMLEFDLDSLSLDLEPAAERSPEAVTLMPEDPLETKFSLAEEFRILGDAEGARELAEEVLAEARGPLKTKAQAFLNALT